LLVNKIDQSLNFVGFFPDLGLPLTECTAVIFVNVVQNGELSKGLIERGIWFKNGYWFKPTVSLTKSNDGTYTSQLEHFLFVSKNHVENKSFSKKNLIDFEFYSSSLKIGFIP
jgi:hypothetical protein